MSTRCKPTGISVHAVGDTRYCFECGNPDHIGNMSERHPVEGLTVWECRKCSTPSPNPRAARLAAGLTQAQAAMLIDAKRRTWQEWEGGRRNMPQSKFALFLMLTQRSEVKQ